MTTQLDKKVLKPSEFCGNFYGDFGYELNGIKSKNGYISRVGAQKALERAVEKLQKRST